MAEGYRKALVYVQGIKAGILSETEDGYMFAYLKEYFEADGPPISITMPVSEEPYQSTVLFPFFDGLIPEDREQMALTINGKKSRLKKSDFLAFAEKCDISSAAAEKMIRKMCSFEQKFHDECDQSYLSDELKVKTKDLISERIKILMS